MTPHTHELITDIVAGADELWDELVGVISKEPGYDWRKLEAIRARLEALRPEELALPSEDLAREVFGLEYRGNDQPGLRGLILAYRYKMLAGQLLNAVLQ